MTWDLFNSFRSLKPCSHCGGEKEKGKRKRLCNTCRANEGRKPCRICGGVKPPGKGRAYCHSCAQDVIDNKAPKAYEATLRSNLRRRFGITPEELRQMISAQDGLCAICQKECSSGQRLAVDHDHQTGSIRGLLCRKCNMALGLLGDDKAIVERALGYLQNV